jgi:hypothetical protein
MDVVNLPEGLDIYETTLPLFERSLIDPENPALNEDGEFPEFDINISYNSEILKRLNLNLNYISKNYKHNNMSSKRYTYIDKHGFRPQGSDYESLYSELIKEDSFDNINNNNDFNRSFSFKIGNIDKNLVNSLDINLKKEIINLKKSLQFRKSNYFFGSITNIFFEMGNIFDLSTLDLGDIIDVLSVKELHPLTFSSEQVFMDLIDQKLDEGIEYSSLTGIDYSNLFINYKSLKFSNTLS